MTSLAERITYTSMSGVNDSATQVTAAVFVPKGDPPASGWPMVSFGHQATGIQPDCAPSLSPTLSGESAAIVELVEAGYVVAAPDYQGLGLKSTYHPFLDSTTEGYNLIDAMSAVRTAIRGTSDKWVAFGTGQGGQFIHRDELVYLPPAWYAANPPPALPALMMIGAKFGHPSDLPTVGVVKVLDKFAAEHGGNAPVVVFVDQSGTFSNDTECVNGPRGNAADHLTKDVVPLIVSTFGVPADPSRWGIAGWSTGGTCALTLAVKYPNLFSAFVDIEGDFGPNAGTKQQTIYRLFDGDEKAWAAFDPTTLMVEHGHYQGMSAWFGISGTEPPVYRAGAADPNGVGVPQPSNVWDHTEVAKYMCALASVHGIQCAVVSQPGKHDFPSAVGMFASSLPWLAGKLGTPGVPRVPLPGEGPP